jgi:hypothetical protein
MITDPAALSFIRQQWTTVTRFRAGSHRQSMIPGGPCINETPPESFFNLPMILAFAVLDQVLDEFIDQGLVPRPPGRRPLLGTKMEVSRSAIHWHDYPRVERGKNERNGVAHEGRILDRKSCLDFIDAIESELRAWQILQ